MIFSPSSSQGTLHAYCPKLSAFEHQPAEATPATNYILWIGGLGDTLSSVSYPAQLARLLPPTWSLTVLQLSSSGAGWTNSSLSQDAQEIAQCVTYFRTAVHPTRSPGTTPKVLLMGHSTGANDILEYLVGPLPVGLPAAIGWEALDHPVIDGVVLQSGVSDRENLARLLLPEELEAAVSKARAMVAAGEGAAAMPGDLELDNAYGAVLPSARRFLSLASEQPREALDDFFSSDLPDDRAGPIWGALKARGVPVLVLLSELDEFVPDELDKEGLVRRWRKLFGSEALWSEESGVVPMASHNLNGNQKVVVEDLAGRVRRFVEKIGEM